MKVQKSSADSVSAAGSMLLFLLFAGCMLIIVAVAAGTYTRISSDFDDTFTKSASLRYISNKLKSADSAEIIDGVGLVLMQDGIKCVIYCSDGGLYENSISADSEPSAQGGDRIFELSSFDVSEENGLYRVTVAVDGESGFVLVRRE